MCGIIGLIGSSKDPKATYQFVEALLVKTQSRGEHATGWWGSQSGNGEVIYHKEPNKAVEVVKGQQWKIVAEKNPNLFIGHCRFSTPNVGHEKYNKNNHPHVSDDYCLALVHNGKITEYRDIKQYYECTSECDSEILLRMMELQNDYFDQDEYLKGVFPQFFAPENSEDRPDLAVRLLGMKEIFSKVNYGAMAVAVAERLPDGRRALWLTRDDERPLHVIDMRENLGQIFFVSTPEIFRDAVEACPEIRKYVAKDKPIIEFPSMQIWVLTTDDNNNIDFKKFKVTKTRKIENHLKKSAKKAKPKQFPHGEVTVITALNKSDEPKDGSTFNKTSHLHNNTTTNYTKNNYSTTTKKKEEDPIMAGLAEKTDELCTKLSELAAEINTTLQNRVIDKSVDHSILRSYIEILEQKVAESQEIFDAAKEAKEEKAAETTVNETQTTVD